MQSLNNFFEDNKKININVDNDGILSSVILKKYYDCEICGFNNNDKIVIHEKGLKYDDLVYVDLHVGYPHIKSIDQHMVSVDIEHNNYLQSNLNKINPNIDYGVIWENYVNKFPFSTTIFLLIKAEADGKDLSELDLYKHITPKIRLGDLIWQTDSSHDNYFKYNRNAVNWKNRMLELTNNGEFTKRLFDFVEKEVPSDGSERGTYSMHIALWYRENFKCTNNHGGYRDGFLTEKGNISDDFAKYLNTISYAFNIDKMNVENKIFDITTFKSRRFSYKDKKNTFNSTKLFSYGFIWGLNKDNNISATYE